MTLLVDRLFRLRQEEAQDRLVTPVLLEVTVSQAAGAVIATGFVVPADRLLVINSVSSSCTPGAGQQVVAQRIQLVSPTANKIVEIAADLLIYGAGLAAALNFAGEILVPPTWQLRARGDYSAAGLANQTTIDFCGYTVPVGNVDRTV